ncbi:hypothetical protein [Azospirillum sp. ST 5-10]|uniref:hypothetical protein n=1 Tax=unclassified Azospirillum TaxID=2630922 RepID=UPI003F4A2E6E
MSTATNVHAPLTGRLLRVAVPAALSLVVSACNLDGSEVATGDTGYTGPTIRYAEADHPAWGDPRWSMQYAYNGRCDDPRYRTSNGGLAEPGTDEADCGKFGDGLR